MEHSLKTFPIRTWTFVFLFLVVAWNGHIVPKTLALKDIPNRPIRSYFKEGDINLGAFLAITEYSPISLCGERIRFPLLQQFVEALVYAIEKINADDNLLPNVTLGYAILDDCVKESTAVAQALRFLPRKPDVYCITPDQCTNNGGATLLLSNTSLPETPDTHYDVVGVIGPLKSGNSIAVSYLLGPAKIPQISFLSTSDELSNKELHSYFLRVVPPDEYQVQAIMTFIHSQGWSYISVLFASGSYGEFAFDNIKRIAPSLKICIATQHKINLAMSDNDFLKIVEDLLKYPRARVVIAFLGGQEIVGVFKAVHQLNSAGKFIWIGSDGWADRLSLVPERYHDAMYGAFTTTVYSRPVPEFNEHFRSIKPSNTSNPWFHEFWERQFGCSFELGTCHESMDIADSPTFSFLTQTSSALDSVYTYAHALHQILQDQCPGVGGAEARRCVHGEQLIGYLRNTSFDGYTGHISFDDKGNMLGRYVISQVRPGRPLQQVRIALIDTTSDRNITALDAISWEFVSPSDLGFTSEDILPAPTIPPGSNSSPPVSVCSRLCAVGEYRIAKEQTCCWECRKCRENERTIDNNTACEICPVFHWPDPNTNLTTCELIPPDFPSNSSPIVVMEICLSVAGIISSLLVFFAYVYFREQRIIKAASRELSFLQLVAILLGYITMLVYAAPPTHARCATAYFLFCLTFNWIYAPLLVKAVRIYRIFHSAAKGARQLKVVSPLSQILLSSAIVLGQVLMCVVVTALDHPSARLSQLVRTDKYVELSCDMTISGMSSFFAYNLTLVILCSVLAFKTRKLPDNFNESRFISMCVSTTLVIWLAFIPTYLTSSREYLKTLLLCLALLLNHSVALIFLFVTKIYAVLYVERQLPSTAVGSENGMVGGVGGMVRVGGAQLTTTTTASSATGFNVTRYRTSTTSPLSGPPAMPLPPPGVSSFNNRVNPYPVTT